MHPSKNIISLLYTPDPESTVPVTGSGGSGGGAIVQGPPPPKKTTIFGPKYALLRGSMPPGPLWSAYKFLQKLPPRLSISGSATGTYQRPISSGMVSEINISSKCINYRMFKTSLHLEDYLLKLSYHQRYTMAKFRCRNHNLPIESGCVLISLVI